MAALAATILWGLGYPDDVDGESEAPRIAPCHPRLLRPRCRRPSRRRLPHPPPITPPVSRDSTALRRLVAWLEDRVVRALPADGPDRAALRAGADPAGNPAGAAAWPAALCSYLDTLGCPFEISRETSAAPEPTPPPTAGANGDAGTAVPDPNSAAPASAPAPAPTRHLGLPPPGEPGRRPPLAPASADLARAIGWLLSTAANEASRDAAGPASGSAGSVPAAAGAGAPASGPRVPGGPRDPHTRRPRNDPLAPFLPPDPRPEAAAAGAEDEAGTDTDQGAARSGGAADPDSLARCAAALRVLYVADLQRLQTAADRLIERAQTATADPRTDARLGKVGR